MKKLRRFLPVLILILALIVLFAPSGNNNGVAPVTTTASPAPAGSDGDLLLLQPQPEGDDSGTPSPVSEPEQNVQTEDPAPEEEEPLMQVAYIERKREIRIHSDGKVYRTITNAKANTITDNIYRYATREEYYLCAEHAFEEILSVLKGQRIAQPMKYLSNALLALILSVLLNFSWLKARAKKLKPKRAVVLAVSGMAAVAAACKAERFIRQTKVYHSSSSGGGGGGRGGGGGGGGHSGGGGGHWF